jgi:hypothetical protein
MCQHQTENQASKEECLTRNVLFAHLITGKIVRGPGLQQSTPTCGTLLANAFTRHDFTGVSRRNESIPSTSNRSTPRGVLKMLWLPIVFLALTMLFVVTAFALMFCSVAFADVNGEPVRQSAGWELPMLSGERLRSWSANLARRVVARHAHHPRSAETPLAIATELEAGANAVLEQAAHRLQSDVAKTCPNTRPRQVAVTAPEVFAIAAELERNCPKSELHVIRELAVVNARRARSVDAVEFPNAGINCPLRTKDGHCMTFISRPIACRRLCSSCPCGGNGSCRTAGAKSSDSPSSVAEQLQVGMTNGLSDGLREAGLDAGVYELNDALATVLTTPQAASRWSRGEAVFANCAKV